MNKLLLKNIKIFGIQFRLIDVIFLIAVILVSMLVRVSLYPHQSWDYILCLKEWFISYKENLSYTLAHPVGDYTAIYNYILAILSLLGNNSLYLIKTVSVIFDYIGAIVFSLIVFSITDNRKITLIGFAVFLMLPTVILNSSAWAQCDIIYATFILLAFYMILKNKYMLAMVFYSISFSIKLQAIFFLPFLIFLFVKGKIKARYFLFIPAVYCLSNLPMMMFGRSFADCIKTYFLQMNGYSGLVYSAPSLYAFFNIEESKMLVNTGTLYCIFVVGFICYLFYEKVGKGENKNLLYLATLLLLVIPYFLPKMHDRYFFLADIFTVLCALSNRKFVVPALITCGCSTIVYIQFLFDSSYMDLRILSFLLLIGISSFIITFMKVQKSK